MCISVKSQLCFIDCFNKREAKPCEEIGGIWLNQTCFNETYWESANTTVCDASGDCQSYNPVKEELTNLTKGAVSSAGEYFEREILKMSSGIEDTGEIRWQLVVALLAGWILIFVCVIKGIKSSGKVRMKSSK
eukprot:GHVO01060474.1.p1 GENE.GHVO01060474.1~~GHVO01060474.1.p1  ORF type:complete len:133 (+),score=13.22 GHVO01060474.1:150-548(+)